MPDDRLWYDEDGRGLTPGEWKDRALKAEGRVEELTRLGTHHVTRLLDCVRVGYKSHPWVVSAREWRDANDPERGEVTDGPA